jgi:uncharacterized damage-inducible protein DinB
MPATSSGIEFAELLSYSEAETRRWRAWFRAHPEALAVEAGIADAQNVFELLLHIFWVQLRFAQLTAGVSPSAKDNLHAANLDQLFAVSDLASRTLRNFLENAGTEDFNMVIQLPADAGIRSATRRKLIAHAILHGVRHWAQIATALRKAQYPQTWPHDFLFSDAME